MDFYISIYTLNKLDRILNDYKKKIIKDFYELNKLTIDYQQFENSILERKIYNIPKKELDCNKCHAYIWKKGYGKVQCSINQTNDNFCKKHSLNQNYGIINF